MARNLLQEAGLTPEEARMRLRRMQSPQMAIPLTREEIHEQTRAAFNKDLENAGSLESLGKSFAHGIGNIGSGGLQYLGIDTPEYARNREEELETLSRNNPISTQTGKLLGELFATLPALGLGKALGSGSSLLGNTLRGGAKGAFQGGILGGLEYTNPEESALENALTNAAGVGILGAGLPIVGAAAKTAKILPKALSKEKIGKQILKDEQAIRSEYGKGYQELFETAKASGIDKIKSPSFDVIEDLKEIPKRYRKALDKFKSDPTLENAQKAQSELGRYAHQIKNSTKQQRPTPTEFNAADAAKEAQKRLRGMMFDALNKKDPKLAKQYQSLTKGYEKEVVPYMTKASRKYKAGELSEKDLTSALQRDKKFMLDFENKYPELRLNKTLTSDAVTKWLPAAAVGAYGGHQLLDSLLGGHK